MDDQTPQSTPALVPQTGGNAPSGPFDGYICFAVYAAGLAFNRLYKPLLDRFGLTYPQYLTMVALRARDGQSVSELGEALFLESNTLTPMIKRMEAAGLVARQRDKRDERVVRVTLTEDGRHLAEGLECVPGELVAAIGMDPALLKAETALLNDLGERLRAAAVCA